MNSKSDKTSSSLMEIAQVFLKLGTTAFGGPAAHIAMMNEEAVHKRQWITQEHFLDLLSATNFIPGPNSTELAIHLGHHRGGRKGLIVAGACFILPAALIVSVIAWAYVRFGSLPSVQSMLYGIKPVIIAVVFQAIWSLGKSAIKNKWLAILALLTFLSNFFGVNELLVIALAGVIALFVETKFQKKFFTQALFPLSAPVASAVAVTNILPVTAGRLFLFFVKTGSVLFGSGYVLLAFLRTDLVEKWHWLSQSQLLDAIAVGQFTPGPVFTTATFIGYLLQGPQGALLATVGIFLPAFFFVAITAPWIPKLRKSKSLSAALDGVNVASLAVMSVTSLFLARQALVDGLTVSIALVSSIILIRWKINSAWLVLAGAILGYFLY